MTQITEEVNREQRSSSRHSMCKAPEKEKSMARLEGLGEGLCDARGPERGGEQWATRLHTSGCPLINQGLGATGGFGFHFKTTGQVFNKTITQWSRKDTNHINDVRAGGQQNVIWLGESNANATQRTQRGMEGHVHSLGPQFLSLHNWTLRSRHSKGDLHGLPNRPLKSQQTTSCDKMTKKQGRCCARRRVTVSFKTMSLQLPTF